MTYGPTASRATKLAAAIFPGPDDENPTMVERWFVARGDIRNSKEIGDEVSEFFNAGDVKEVILADGVSGCPHEEGIDYPLGGVCPECPFWSETDRFTHGPKSPEESSLPGQHITTPEIVTALSEKRGCPPKAALASADVRREELTPVLLEAIQTAIKNPEECSDEEANLACHAVYLLAKWREPRALAGILAWLALSEDDAEYLAGDIMHEGGPVFLASVSGGDRPEIRALIENPAANEYGRSAALSALATLVLWGEMPEDSLVAYLRELIETKLEREPNFVWVELALVVAEFGMASLTPLLRPAFEAGWVDESAISWEDFESESTSPPGQPLEARKEHSQPIIDVAEETADWGCYHESAPENPATAPAKVGRNDQCPCGSGKKYKKCCGAAA